MTAKRYVSANEYLSSTWKLAAAVRGGGWRPDVLLALWRGGAAVGAAIHEFLKVTGWDVRHTPLKTASYSGIGERGRVEISPEGAVESCVRKGDKVLVVDDVFDTGGTAAAVKEKIESAGASFRIACVYWKEGCSRFPLVPDYFAEKQGAEWIVFPHEIEGLSPEEVFVKDPALAALVAKFRN